jgi:hypothetical protein
MDTEIKVIVTCIVIFVALLIILFVYQLSFFLPDLTKNYILTSNGHVTFSDHDLSLTIENSHKNNVRVIIIDGLDNASQPIIYSSVLSSSAGYTIQPHTTINFTGGIAKVGFSVDNFSQLGSYDGWSIIRGGKNNFVVPINVSAPPMLPQALAIIVIGSVSSIAFWEFLKYSDRKKTNEKKIHVDTKADQVFTSAEQTSEQDPLKKLNLYLRATSLKRQKDDLYGKERSLSRRYATNQDKAKITLLDIGASGFGIVVGLLGLLNNSYVTAITVISYQDIGVLFGLGFATASLKELIDKPSAT